MYLKDKIVKINIRLPDGLYKWLLFRSSALNLTVSEYIRKILNSYRFGGAEYGNIEADSGNKL